MKDTTTTTTTTPSSAPGSPAAIMVRPRIEAASLARWDELDVASVADLIGAVRRTRTRMAIGTTISMLGGFAIVGAAMAGMIGLPLWGQAAVAWVAAGLSIGNLIIQRTALQSESRQLGIAPAAVKRLTAELRTVDRRGLRSDADRELAQRLLGSPPD